MRPNLHLLDTLLELQALDRVPRSGYALRGIAEPESVSEHCFHLIFLVWALCSEEPGLDRARAVELALLHDVSEVRFGDLPRTAAHYLPRGAKAEAETAAAEDILAPLGPRATELHAEYSAHETPEALFVSACDKLQLLIKTSVYETWGARGVDELRLHAEQLDDHGFSSIRRVVKELRKRHDKRCREQEVP